MTHEPFHRFFYCKTTRGPLLPGLLCCLLPLLACRAGSVRLFNGETHTGKISIASTGLAITEDHNNAIYDLQNVLSASLDENPPSEPATLSHGLVLSNGSFVSGPTKLPDAPTLKVGQATVPRASVAAVVFSSVRPPDMYRLKNGRTGAILPDGDFFEGTFTGIKNGAAVIDSTLLGIHSFALSSGIAAVVLGEIKTAGARFDIVTKGGSRYFATDLRVEHDGLQVTDSILGQVKVGSDDVSEIHAGAGRYQLLTELRPAATVAASGAAAPASAVSTAGQWDGQPALSANAGVAVTYDIPQGISVFACSVAVPKETPAAARVTFAVYCDGKLAVRSMQAGPASTPLPLRVSFGPAKKITLRAEPAVPGSDAVTGKWIMPLFLKQ